MNTYTFQTQHPEQQFIQITFRFDAKGADRTKVQLPAWRPGRYELGNFAKNVRGWQAFDEHNEPISAQKVSKDCWEVATAGVQTVSIRYEYYAAELNAGSTWLDADQLYVNPVNCCLYLPGREEEACQIELDVPTNYEVAIGLPKVGDKRYEAQGFQELADSPFIASVGLQHNQFECGNTVYHIWFQGEVKPDWPRIIKDFKGYTEAQLNVFGELPVDEYHYLFQIAPYKLYHGVEHLNSTVIALGPSYDIMTRLYTEFLGVSSHELFHSWNIKAIRPQEMLPYDFSQENYSKLGYVAEGVTTYYGDLMLRKGDVFDDKQYFKELGRYLQRHYDNYGRFNSSVAESSFDTWLDGYAAGIPHRKGSIYVEGCVAAFLTDVMIRRETNHKKSLDTVMKQLFDQFGREGVGYTENDYMTLVAKAVGKDVKPFFEKYLYGTTDTKPAVREALRWLGCQLMSKPSAKAHEAQFGFKTMEKDSHTEVVAVAPDSPAFTAGIAVKDVVVSINGMGVKADLSNWISYFGGEAVKLDILRSNQTLSLTVTPAEQPIYQQWWIEHRSDATAEERSNFSQWATNQ